MWRTQLENNRWYEVLKCPLSTHHSTLKIYLFIPFKSTLILTSFWRFYSVLKLNSTYEYINCTSYFRQICINKNEQNEIFDLLATFFMLISYLAYSSTWKILGTSFSEMSIDFHLITLNYIPENRTLHRHCSENLNSHQNKEIWCIRSNFVRTYVSKTLFRSQPL